MSLLIKEVSQIYDTATAVDDISVEIQDGEFIAILGPSGCGKTTLLRIIAGFIHATRGTVLSGDEVFTRNKFHMPVNARDLSMVFQSFALWPHMTVREHIEYPLQSKRQSHLSADEKKAMVDEAIRSTGLEKLQTRLPGELSGGQKQRVSLARAIVSKPKLLLMDEPLSALDAELKISMRKEIKDIHTMTKSTIIYVTHDQSEALSMADRIIIMKDGKIEQMGTPKEIYEQPQTIFAATFVSKCNLVKGTYNGDDFTAYDGVTKYDGAGLPVCFKEANVYPVRPEDFTMNNTKDGIVGVITNKQYNGREIHYKVECDSDFFTVYSDVLADFAIGDTIYLKKETK
ncbi:ABC transporter ATP-binding protein [Chakrabartyella piscis]|uniref:ABC transporter ATP-binding protein n=1 Tax=Chakrabartyella piscis TaxID=2918914 RepID=UPI002958B2D9|nr:ABC transporter ATP-binding protein [Chakrabartyella piscis]